MINIVKNLDWNDADLRDFSEKLDLKFDPLVYYYSFSQHFQTKHGFATSMMTCGEEPDTNAYYDYFFGYVSLEPEGEEYYNLLALELKMKLNGETNNYHIQNEMNMLNKSHIVISGGEEEWNWLCYRRPLRVIAPLLMAFPAIGFPIDLNK